MRRTPLHDRHSKLGAKLVEFGGWHMPLQYTTITEEHLATRKAAGLFDLSHMGRLEIHGSGRDGFLQKTTTADIGRLPVGKGRYSFVCNEQGGVIDDIIIYRLEDHWLLVVNAGNRESVLAWLSQQRNGIDAEVRDRTEDVAMLAVQGPRAQEILAGLTDGPLDDLRYYWVRPMEVAGVACGVARTGYTGEDGFEVFVPAAEAGALWNQLLEVGDGRGMLPSGLGARDTLRLEAAMPLYGHELSIELTPLHAGLGKFVALGREFIGKAALESLAAGTIDRVLVGLEVEGKRIPRQGATVLRDGAEVGVVTSGTRSPSLDRTIALAYVEGGAPEGGACEVDVRGKRSGARVVALPFYKRGK